MKSAEFLLTEAWARHSNALRTDLADVRCRSCSRHGAFTPCGIGTSASRSMEGFILIIILIHNCLFLISFLQACPSVSCNSSLLCCVVLFSRFTWSIFWITPLVTSWNPIWISCSRSWSEFMFSASLSLSTELRCFKYDFSIILFVCCSWGGVGALDCLPPFPAVFFVLHLCEQRCCCLPSATTGCTTCDPGELENPEGIWESAFIWLLSLGNCLRCSSSAGTVCVPEGSFWAWPLPHSRWQQFAVPSAPQHSADVAQVGWSPESPLCGCARSVAGRAEWPVCFSSPKH